MDRRAVRTAKSVAALCPAMWRHRAVAGQWRPIVRFRLVKVGRPQ